MHVKASGRSKLTREPKQIDAHLGKQVGAEFSALFVKRCLVALSGLCRPVWISPMTKPAEDRVAGEFNPAGRLKMPMATVSGSSARVPARKAHRTGAPAARVEPSSTIDRGACVGAFADRLSIAR